MQPPVTLERYVGPALCVHARGAVVIHEDTFDAGAVIPLHVHADPVISAAQDLLLTPAYAVEHARTEISKGNRPLGAIALEARFADQSHFTRVLRQSCGETPGQYARSLRSRIHWPL